MHIPFQNTYARLPDQFYARLNPTPVAAPKLLRINRALAAELGIDPDAPDAADVFGGNAVPEGAEPMALAYAGHQFGGFSPALGDGRACLLGEVAGRDIQLKGSGPTPFSRNGDGRAAMGPVLREYLISEAMAAMGIPTTRTLAAVATGEIVRRETRLPGAVLTRVASSHIRVGTFQYFAARGDADSVRILADYAIARHYPDAAGAENPYLAFLKAVVVRQAELVAQWLLVGFIHGVMNTDNCSVAGETIDYGPCAFMDAYDPATVFSSIDEYGRYAYANQPRIALWNLTRLAECLLDLVGGEEPAKQALAGFAAVFQDTYDTGLRRKIGLRTHRDGDEALVTDLLALMKADAADFTLTFRGLYAGDASAQFKNAGAYAEWAARWRVRLEGEHAPAETMRMANPAFIPRNHLVEAALNAAIREHDLAPFDELLAVVTRPFDGDAGGERFARPPLESEKVLQTFCGT